tara:strand:- start:1721 stop:2407 length:687 start_codon:yes stop_codon:yes gene_type:complete
MKRHLKGLALKQYKATLPKFNQRQKNIIVGTLLGDSTLLKSKAIKSLYSLKFEQQAKNKDYLDSIYNEFIDWSGSPPKFYIKECGFIKSYWFKTYGHRAFDFYANQFYAINDETKDKTRDKTKKRKKVVPKLIHRWLNEESLAYWYMDDGNKDKYGYVLNTQGFSLRDNERLADALGKCFKFEVNIHKDNNYQTGKRGHRLYITARSRDNFTKVVKDYILPSFKYKLF